MDINTSRKNLLAHLHLLPAPVQADVKFLLEKFDAAVREPEELNRNMAVQNKVEDLPHEVWRDIAGYEGCGLKAIFTNKDRTPKQVLTFLSLILRVATL